MPALAQSFDLFGTLDAPASPVVLSVPHAGRDYPAELQTALRVPLSALVALEDRYVDRLALAAHGGETLLIQRTARAWIDLNRAESERDPRIDDGAAPQRHATQSAKLRGGLGLVPRRLSATGDLWRRRFGNAEMIARIAADHRPYHAAAGDGAAGCAPPLRHGGAAGRALDAAARHRADRARRPLRPLRIGALRPADRGGGRRRGTATGAQQPLCRRTHPRFPRPPRPGGTRGADRIQPQRSISIRRSISPARALRAPPPCCAASSTRSPTRRCAALPRWQRNRSRHKKTTPCICTRWPRFREETRLKGASYDLAKGGTRGRTRRI